jgi:hypothetical protein
VGGGEAAEVVKNKIKNAVEIHCRERKERMCKTRSFIGTTDVHQRPPGRGFFEV